VATPAPDAESSSTSGKETSADPRSLLAALGRRPAARAVPIRGGWDTTIWRVELDGAAYALRLFRAEQRAAAAYEALAMRTAAAAGLPAPRIEAEGTWQDRPVVLLGWCPGRTLADEAAAHPWRVWRLGLAFGATQARIHRIPVSEPLRAGSRPWIEWVGPEQTALHELLRAIAGPDRLLHLDYHPLNVLTDGRGVTGVIDWVNARVGDPRADLARTIAIIRLAPPPPGLHGPAVAALRRLLELAWRRGYAAIAGQPRAMAPFHAWAGAVMLRDLGPKLGRPGVPLAEADLHRIRTWTDRWRLRAGLV
jgi:aminoglycoside phosphotransferase (APT) family kinase protein